MVVGCRDILKVPSYPPTTILMAFFHLVHLFKDTEICDIFIKRKSIHIHLGLKHQDLNVFCHKLDSCRQSQTNTPRICILVVALQHIEIQYQDVSLRILAFSHMVIGWQICQNYTSQE